MDAKLLYELKFEMDRIYINGMRSARNNPRIIKALHILEKSTDRDVTQELRRGLKTLIETSGFDLVAVLSTINTSLCYLLRLHEETFVPGEERTAQVPVLDINDIPDKQLSFLELHPLISALTKEAKSPSDVSKKVKIIKKARAERLFEDLRTYHFLDKALANEQPEIVELAINVIKHEIGDEMIPFLLNRFECNDKVENQNRLELLFALNYKDLNGLLEEIMSSNAEKLQAKAIQFISDNIAFEDILINLSESPQKPLKEKALSGLAGLKTEKAEKKLYELYAKAVKKRNRGEVELLAKALSQTALLYTFDDVFARAKELFDAIIVANKKAEAELFNCLRSAISVFAQKGRADVHDFFLEILCSSHYNEIVKKKEHVLAKPAKSLSYAIIDAVQQPDTEQLIAFYEKVIREMEESGWKSPFYKAYLNESIRRGDSAEQVYEVFAPHYRNKNLNAGDIAGISAMGEAAGNPPNAIDSRWLDQLYDTLRHIDEEENIDTLLHVLDVLETASPERYNQELIEAGRATKKHLLEITAMIMKRNLLEKYEIVYSLVKHCHDRGAEGSNALRQLPRATYWPEFPNEYAAKFRELKNAPKAIYTKIEQQVYE